jgi:hypothetical protein
MVLDTPLASEVAVSETGVGMSIVVGACTVKVAVL